MITTSREAQAAVLRLADMDVDQLLTIEAVGELLECSRPHVYRLMKSGALSGVDISEEGSSRSKMRIRRGALQGYIESNTWSAV